jgi:hypothetical protein
MKIYGRRTLGSLDFSNMYFTNSPGRDFTLYYTMSRSFRLPDFAMDGTGIQPDYYLMLRDL